MPVVELYQKMILLEFSGIGPHQLDDWLRMVPKCWRKNRGFALWGVGLDFKASTDRHFQHEYLVITEWEFSMMKGNRTLIVFLFNLLENTCEVTISWYSAYEERLVKTVSDAFENLYDPE